MKSTEVRYPANTTGRLVGYFFLALIPLVTLVPYSSMPFWLTQDLLIRWVSVIIFFLCFRDLAMGIGRKPEVRLDLPNALLLFLAAWILLSVKNSPQAFDSFYAFRSFLCILLLWFSLRSIWERWPGLYPAFEKVFYWTSIIASIWLVISTIGHFFQVPLFAQMVPQKGFFPNQNIAAGFLGLALIWGSLKRSHGQPFPFWVLGLYLLAWGLTESRGALLSMTFVVVLYLVLHMKEIEKRLSQWGKPQWLVFGGAVLFLSGCLVLMVNRLLNAENLDPRAYYRLDLWRGVLRMAADQPWFGFGPGTFQEAFLAYRPASIWTTSTAAAHNEFLQVAVECGWPALGFLLLFLWVVLREKWKDLFKVPAFQTASASLLASETAFFLVLYEVAHNCIDFTFHEWSHRLVLLAILTYSFRVRAAEDDLKISLTFSRRAFWGCVAVLCLAVVWALGVGGLRDYMARLYDFRAMTLLQGGNLELAEKLETRSLRFRPDFSKPWNFLGAIEDARGERAEGPAEKRRHFQLAEEYFEKAIGLSPYQVEPMENRVRLMRVQRRLSQALDLQNGLVKRMPEYPLGYIVRGDILLDLGRAQEGIASAQKAIDLDRYYLPSYFLKAQAMEALGKKKDALLVFEEVRDMLNRLGLKDPSGLVEPNIQRLKAKN